MSNLYDIFSECEKWENTPISELLGNNSINLNQKLNKIIVYGATQMGKTTMIMNLIGIKDEKKKELSDLLRGNSTHGNSSTSTPIVYNCWDSELFGIASGNETEEFEGTRREFTKEQFKEAIESINSNQRAEKTTSTGDNNVRYYFIPREFFKEEKFNKDIQIIDLPGFGEKNTRMLAEADTIINRMATIAAGTVAVVRADKITNLSNEYKNFLDEHHVNHLAIAITHALSVDSEMKNKIKSKTDFFANCSTAEEYANAILGYVYEKLTGQNGNEGYISAQKYTIETIFPVEKTEEVRRKFPDIPELAEAFDIILEKLLARMDSMKNTTSINACVEKLQELNEVLDDKLVQNKQQKDDAEEKKGEIEKAAEKNTEALLNQKEKVEQEKKKIDEIEKTCQHVMEEFEEMREKTFPCSDNRYYKREVLLWHTDVDLMCEVMVEFIEKGLGDLKSPLKKDFSRIIRGTLSNGDFSEVSKKRVFEENGLAAIYSYYLSAKDQLFGDKTPYTGRMEEGKLEKQLKANKRAEITKITKKLAEEKKKMLKQKEMQRIFENQLEEVSGEIENYENRISALEARKEVVSKNKGKVVEIFAEHFFKKEKELLERMEKEKDAETVAALFLTYSAIYLNIKPYLEEGQDE